MNYASLTPDALTEKALAEMHEPVRYRAIETDGAARAASVPFSTRLRKKYSGAAMTIKFLAGVTAIAALFATIPGHGTLVTTSAGFASPTVDTFGAYNFCATFAQSGCTPPQTLFGTSIQYTGTAGVRGSSLNNGGFGLGTNGEWNSGRNGYVGNDDGAAFSRFTFSTPLSAIGGLSTTHPVSAAPSRSLRTSQFGNARTAHRPGGGQALVGESMNADTPIAVIENIFVIRLGRNP